MKIRTCFISNSSSCSFVLFGFALSREPNLDWEKWEEIQETLGYDVKRIPQSPDADHDLVGYAIQSDDAQQMFAGEWELSDILRHVENIRQTLNIAKDVPMKVYSGMRSC